MKKHLLPLLLGSTALLALPLQAAADYTRSKYPIVLSHGLFGFASIGPVDYWYGIPRDLQSGGAKVFTTAQTPAQSHDVRGEQLLAQVETIQAITGAAKVNLIGHSQGGMTVRYVAAVAPSRVASVTSISTPHKGTPVADAVQGFSGVVGSTGTKVIAAAVNAIAWLIDAGDGSAGTQDALAAMNVLSTSGASAFNQRFPAGIPTTACGAGAASVNGIRYYSWSGTSHLTSLLDPSDYSMAATGLLISGPNDGLVPRCSSNLGTVIRNDYRMNHLDTVNQAFGLVSILETNPKTVFRQHANRLKLAGL